MYDCLIHCCCKYLFLLNEAHSTSSEYACNTQNFRTMMNDKQFWAMQKEVEPGDFVFSPEDFDVDHMTYKAGRGRGKASTL
jgi:hypothetical protein